MKPGIYPNIPMKQYHTGPGWSKSHCDQVARSPAHLAVYLQQQRAQTEAFSFGEEAHRLILEPDTASRVVKKPNVGRRSNNDRKYWCSFFNENGANGKTIISLPATYWDAEFARQTDKLLLTENQLQDIKILRESVFAHPEACKLLEDGVPEQSQYWVEPTTGLLIRNRIDWIHDDFILVDLKTTADASPEAFSYTAAKYRYHVQEAMYADGFKDLTKEPENPPFVFIAVEKSSPYAVGVYQLTMWARERGRQLYLHELKTIKNSVDSGVWGAYSDQIETIDLPKRAY